MKCPDCKQTFKDNRKDRLFSIGTKKERHYFNIKASSCPRCGQIFIEKADIDRELKTFERSGEIQLEDVGKLK